MEKERNEDCSTDRMDADMAEVTLGRRLYEEIERLDPSFDERGWGLLTDREREFYRLCVRSVLIERDLCRIAIGERPANNNCINRQSMTLSPAVSKQTHSGEQEP